MDESPIFPEFYTGAPVDASDLRFRDAFIDELWEILRTKNVLLTAPRRTGKTSIMDHLREFPRENFTVIYENVQDLSHPADFFGSLLARFHDEHPKFFRDTLGSSWDLVSNALAKVQEVGISEFKVALRESSPDWKENWRAHGEKFLQQVRHHGLPVLLIVDEVPDMLLNLKVENPELLREFLAWFRKQRLHPKPNRDSVRWLVGGSVNLSSTLDSVGMVDLINDFDDVALPPLGDADVMEFVASMLTDRGVLIDDDVPSRFCAKLGRPIPLFMQIVTQDLYRRWKKEKRTLSAAEVDAAFSELVISNAARDKLQHYYSRIDRYYEEPKRSSAYEILSQLSLSEAGFARGRLLQEFERILDDAGVVLPVHQRKQQFNQLLRDLENDFYVSEVTADTYDFASGILKTWWKKYYA